MIVSLLVSVISLLRFASIPDLKGFRRYPDISAVIAAYWVRDIARSVSGVMPRVVVVSVVLFSGPLSINYDLFLFHE